MRVEEQIVLTISKAESWVIYRALCAYQTELHDKRTQFPDTVMPAQDSIGQLLNQLYGLWVEKKESD